MGKSRGDKGDKGRKFRTFGKHVKTTIKSRKEMRKEMRKSKKVRRFMHHSKLNEGAVPEKPIGEGKKRQLGQKHMGKDIAKKPGGSKQQGKKTKATKLHDEKLAEARNELKMEERKLREEMEEVRRKRLLEENEEEERTIRKAEKILKINKKSKIPASFREDGLDYILELVSEKPKKEKKKARDEDENDGDEMDGFGSEVDHDLSDKDDGSEDEFLNEDDEDAVASDDSIEEDLLSDEEDTVPKKKSKVEPTTDSEDNSGSESGDEDSELGDEEIDGESSDEDDEDGGLDPEMESSDSNDEDVAMQEEVVKEKEIRKKTRKAKGVDHGYWEDIYGRLRNKEGAVINEKTMTPVEESKVSTGKYVPPAKRGEEAGRQKITRTLKGLLNRLSEGNMHNVSQQVEQLYMSNSRNEMNECLMELLYASLISDVLSPERLMLEHVMLITILHANVGSEVGAFFIQNFVQKFRALYDQFKDLEGSKQLLNSALLVATMYHFKIVGCTLIFDILEFLSKSFLPKDIELILAVFRSIGFRLRKDDPIKLKNLILLIQQQAANADASSNSRVRFMIEVIMAIKNNNMTKIPNYDPSHGEHLLKIVKQHFHKGNYVTELKIGMEDLLKAETRGRWWIVGSAWSNESDQQHVSSGQSVNTNAGTTASASMNKKLLAKAKKFGMNTDIRRSIFCVIMTAEDYLEAFEKLMHLGLKNQQAREMIHVLVYCCLHEKKYNPFYALIISKLCSVERHFMLTLQYSLWDRLKDLTTLQSQQLDNMSQLLVDLINDKTLSFSVLKVIDFADVTKGKLKFLKSTLAGVLLQKNKENLEEIVFKIGLSEKLHLFRESLKLFLGHFMLQESLDIEGETVKSDWDPVTRKLLEDRIKIVENALQGGRGRLLF